MNPYLSPELNALIPELSEASAVPLQDQDHYIRLDYRRGYFVHQPRDGGSSFSWR